MWLYNYYVFINSLLPPLLPPLVQWARECLIAAVIELGGTPRCSPSQSRLCCFSISISYYILSRSVLLLLVSETERPIRQKWTEPPEEELNTGLRTLVEILSVTPRDRSDHSLEECAFSPPVCPAVFEVLRRADWRPRPRLVLGFIPQLFHNLPEEQTH